MHTVAIGRQPIYDTDLQLIAYELLFRGNTASNHAEFNDGDRATTEVILNTFTEIGLDKLACKMPAFINLTQSFISGEYPLPDITKAVVLEILEDIPVNDALIASIQNLKNAGYTIALDDFIYQQELEPLINTANIIKLDVMAQNMDELKSSVDKLRNRGKKLLAEKIETHEEFESCKQMGFDYYQGYFFCKPEIVTGKTLPTNKLKIIQLLAKLHDTDIHVDDLVEDINTDISLSYRLLRYINSVQFGLQHEIDSIKQAVMLLGWDNIRSIATLMIMSSIEDKPLELIKTGLVRAKMCELIGEHKQSTNTDTYYTVGLLSIIDALMDLTIDEVAKQLPLSTHISDALIYKTGDEGKVLQDVINYVRGNLKTFSAASVDLRTATDSYLQALQWADAVARELVTE